MTEKKPFAYAEAAEHRTDIRGWICRTCRRYHGDDGGSERQARYCCTHESPCEDCGIPTRPYTRCPACMAKRDAEKYAALERVPWDGETPLALSDRETFFWGASELEEYLADNGLVLDDVALVLCEPSRAPMFSLPDLLNESLPEDGDMPPGWQEVEKAVNDWINAQGVLSWVPSRKVPTRESVAACLGEDVLVREGPPEVKP